MNKLTISNYKGVLNANDKTFDLYIDGYIVDADTKMWLSYFDEDVSESYKSVRDQIEQAITNGCNTINCYINSGGGYITEAMAIHDYFVDLQNKGIAVNTFGRGLIASAATYILMAGNSSMSKNSWFMVHNVSGGVWGDVNEVERQAKVLRKFNDTIAQFYANATGLSFEEIDAMMNEETWLTGSEAKEKKFVKECTSIEEEFTNAIEPEKWTFKNMEVLQAYNSFTNKKINNMDFKKASEEIKNKILDHLRDAGVLKNEKDATALDGLPEAIVNALKPLETEFQNSIKEETDKIPNMVKVEVENFLKEKKFENLTTAEDLKKVSDELEEVKKNIADKQAGEAGGEKPKPENAAMEGISFTGK